jgi:hypothetical protein
MTVPPQKGRGERLVCRGRDHATVGTSFVSGSEEISAALVEKASNKACQFYMAFKNTEEGNEYYCGQGGLIQGERLSGTPPVDTQKNKKRRMTTKKVSFTEYACFAATPVTAKHNLESCIDEAFIRTTVRFVDGHETDITMPDGGCILAGEDEIEVRAATEDSSALTWNGQDVSFGAKFENPSNALTRRPRLFEKVPDVRSVLQVGHKIGISIYRTFDITHKDARAPSNVVLEDFYGQKLQACIYTGEVTEISAKAQTFCHNINTFEGCSGAVVFLLDRNQQVELEDTFHGMAVGVHVGGLDSTNNIAFLLS